MSSPRPIFSLLFLFALLLGGCASTFTNVSTAEQLSHEASTHALTSPDRARSATAPEAARSRHTASTLLAPHELNDLALPLR